MFDHILTRTHAGSANENFRRPLQPRPRSASTWRCASSSTRRARARSASGPASPTTASASSTAPTSPRAAAGDAPSRQVAAAGELLHAQPAHAPGDGRARERLLPARRDAAAPGRRRRSGTCRACSAAKRCARRSRPIAASFPRARISFEHAVFLVTALARGDELRAAGCLDCCGLIVVDRLADRRPALPRLRGVPAGEVRLRLAPRNTRRARHSGPVRVRVAMMRTA